MILQALYHYYQRKTADPDAKLAPLGFEWKELPFIFEIDTDGNLIQIEDTRAGSGKEKAARSFLIPKGVKRSVNVKANLLWGNAEYLLGLHDWKKRRAAKKNGRVLNYRNRLAEMHQAFVGKIQGMPVETRSDPGVKSVCRFLEKLNLNDLRRRLRNNFRLRKDLRTLNPNIAFRLQGDIDLVCQRPAVQSTVGGGTNKHAQQGHMSDNRGA
jgi:CRISPR-associated protein Csd1